MMISRRGLLAIERRERRRVDGHIPQGDDATVNDAPCAEIAQSADIFAVAKDRDGFNPRGDNPRPLLGGRLLFGPTRCSHHKSLVVAHKSAI